MIAVLTAFSSRDVSCCCARSSTPGVTMTDLAASQWSIRSSNDDLSGLELRENVPVSSLGADEVLGLMGFKASPDLIPGSDGAGVVLKTGSNVKSVAPGDRVVTHMVPESFDDDDRLTPLDDETLPSMAHICAGLGQGLNGTLATHGVFRESCLAKFSGKMSFEEAATLTCSGITAWNALMGIEGRKVKKGDWVLVQGTGGVSIAALQFALAAGATVIATTSSPAKAAKLQSLGAHHVINYRDNPRWGSEAKGRTPSGRGVDVVVDVGGNATLGESLEAVRIDGLVVAAGLLGSAEDKPELLSVLQKICLVRGVLLGTRRMMRDMIAFVEGNGIKLALDDEVFALAEAKGAYKRLEEQKHFSKVVIKIPGAKK
ncbi:Zinc-type alcohol dehydrogenase-like protein [Paramyrothecium foliicola]|nr:Zinc-type alcohol dehydrogenase-like protein [Paramyrothecium foliicola]